MIWTTQRICLGVVCLIILLSTSALVAAAAPAPLSPWAAAFAALP